MIKCPTPEKTKFIKFPPSRAAKDVKCPENAGGMFKLRFDWYITPDEDKILSGSLVWIWEFDELSLPRGGAFDHYSQGVGDLIASFDFMLRRADSTWRDKSWRRQTLMHSKRKIPNSWRTGWKAKACTSFALYLKVFKNHLCYLRHVRVLSIKPCLHTQLPEHNRNYSKVPRGWGHLIT